MAQISSTTPNGHAPARNPYTLDNTHPRANNRTNRWALYSRAYIPIMNVRAQTPKSVTTGLSEAGLAALRGREDRHDAREDAANQGCRARWQAYNRTVTRDQQITVA